MNRQLILAIILIAIGIIGLLVVSTIPFGMQMGPRGPICPGCPGMWNRRAVGTSFRSNGERIYYTATSNRGTPITATLGPMWFQMHGGSCVNCHGEDGKGGVPVMMGTAVPADIRYSALTSGEHGHKYTDDLIKRAITQGLDADGKPLDPTMPRWQMSPQDLDDLISYLKVLD